MPQSYKVLGQIFPTANALTNVYVSPASTSAIVNTIYITNQDTANANVDIVIRPINETLSDKHYLLRNQKIDAADSIILNINVTMNADVILTANNAYRDGESKSANVSINAFGVEIT